MLLGLCAGIGHCVGAWSDGFQRPVLVQLKGRGFHYLPGNVRTGHVHVSSTYAQLPWRTKI